MYFRDHMPKIFKAIESLEFVDQIDHDEICEYEIDDFQVDVESVYVDDRHEVMDNVKVELLRNKLKAIPELTSMNLEVQWDRTDAYPSGHSSYSITIYDASGSV